MAVIATRAYTQVVIDIIQAPVSETQPNNEAVQMQRVLITRVNVLAIIKEEAKFKSRTLSSKPQAQMVRILQVLCKKNYVIVANIGLQRTSAQLFDVETAAFTQFVNTAMKSTWRREATTTRRRFSACTAGRVIRSPIYASRR